MESSKTMVVAANLSALCSCLTSCHTRPVFFQSTLYPVQNCDDESAQNTIPTRMS
ncbi:hypothetical protein PR003_g14636 [Phytophthora rubi]|uniref:Uncharacterized protein n=1 Tax=Phytophthora rubi TaxID=129364 RepID=A0A6A3N7K7_9STRA|nr:hypothetical protein PR002_g6969 [Phytophthora rubi]KAE9041359.1 hypothetical protein PR001_g6656 [Phytophthora rubi]KAE9332192.1 hypothetical protein PR003_g14636 [Phytophthora rubi]